MAQDPSYNTNIYREQSGDVLNIGNGAILRILSGGTLDVASGGIVASGGSQGAAIADASEAHALNATFSDTEVETALDALGAKINLIIAALEAAGIIAA